MTSEFAIAVHTLVFLNHKAESQSSGEIAENVCTNPARVRKVLAKLKKSGLITTKEGMDGGCLFAGNPREVTLSMVCRAVGEVPVSVSTKTGDPDMDCLIASGMADIMDEIYSKLNRKVYEVLEETTIADIEGRIFGKREK